MAYTVKFRSSVEKELRNLQKKDQGRVLRKIEALADNPYPPKVKKLPGEENYYRIQVGDYRVIYRVEAERLMVRVVKIGHRREVYRRLP